MIDKVVFYDITTTLFAKIKASIENQYPKARGVLADTFVSVKWPVKIAWNYTGTTLTISVDAWESLQGTASEEIHKLIDPIIKASSG